jgi:hypothetical protein
MIFLCPKRGGRKAEWASVTVNILRLLVLISMGRCFIIRGKVVKLIREEFGLESEGRVAEWARQVAKLRKEEKSSCREIISFVNWK